MPQSMIYITAGSREEALGIGRALVKARLAACANVLAGMTSIYWWDGAVNENQEASLIVKTRSDLVDRLVQKVKELHSYDCPCVVALPIGGGNPQFLEWIEAETADASE